MTANTDQFDKICEIRDRMARRAMLSEAFFDGVMFALMEPTANRTPHKFAEAVVTACEDYARKAAQ